MKRIEERWLGARGNHHLAMVDMDFKTICHGTCDEVLQGVEVLKISAIDIGQFAGESSCFQPCEGISES